MRRILTLALVLALLPVGLSACGVRDDEASDEGAASQQAAPSSVSGEVGEGTAEQTQDSLDADAMTRELEAIQRELDETPLPDDTDFSDIENGL